ncbi:30S ribosomal protein 3-1, chloroplastic-like [Andrographis paniculata]|uniref:30S ribosomal protein 3-1, chloroplastic-like n=1 Tax=Andrographis paniculata TaxID=175694 RepID=UPI0021E87D6D|nr:30S ribosomal protein 3-1, chloroplastic-like [Andrographis paniculata]
MLSMSIQPRIESNLTRQPSLAFTNVSFTCLHSKPSLSLQQRKLPPSDLKIESVGTRRLPRAAELATAETPDEVVSEKEEALVEEQPQVGKEAKSRARPRLVLKFIWMEKNIGVGLDQMIPGHGTVPLSPYFFWPRKDAWEELKTTLESKPWISQKKMIILLNQATDIINLWQQSGGNLS